MERHRELTCALARREAPAQAAAPDYYLRPEKYTGRSVAIVCAGANGRDAALQVSKDTHVVCSVHFVVWGMHLRFPQVSVADTRYRAHARHHRSLPGRASHTSRTHRSSSLTSMPSDIDPWDLVRVPHPLFCAPHLSRLAVDSTTPHNLTMVHTLVSNLRDICPLYRRIFSLTPVPPPMVLVLVVLPVLVANCPLDIAQSLFVAHTPTRTPRSSRAARTCSQT